MPAFLAVIRTRTMVAGLTLRKRMKMICRRLTGAFDSSDCHQSQNAFQMSAMIVSAMMPMTAMANRPMMSEVMVSVSASRQGPRAGMSCRTGLPC